MSVTQNKLPGLLAIALAGSAAFAAPTAPTPTPPPLPAADAAMAAMLKRMEEMELRMQQMQARIDELQKGGAKPAPAPATANASPDWGDGPAPTRAEMDQVKQRVARQGMKLDRLFTDAYEGPGAGLQVTGYLDPTYVVNHDLHTASFQFLNQGDPYTYDDSSAGDVFIRITKTFGEGTLAPKADIELAPSRGYGMANTNSSGTVVPSIIHVALATIPIDAQWSFTAGRAAGFGGYEYYESTLMNTITHDLLYDYSIAGNMTGAGFNWTNARQDWTWKFFLANEEYYANGSRVGMRPNRTPTLAARFDYTASTALYYGGSLTAGRNTLYTTDDGCDPGFYGYQCTGTHAYGTVIDAELDMTYQAADLQYNAEVDFGQLANGAWNGGTARWWGVSGLVHKRWSTENFGRWGATLRADYFNNAHNGGGSPSLYLGSAASYGTDPLNGVGIAPSCLAAHADSGEGRDFGQSCQGTNRFALTSTLLFMPTDQWTLKAEARWDHANHAVFQTDPDTFRRWNAIIGLQSVYAF